MIKEDDDDDDDDDSGFFPFPFVVDFLRRRKCG